MTIFSFLQSYLVCPVAFSSLKVYRSLESPPPPLSRALSLFLSVALTLAHSLALSPSHTLSTPCRSQIDGVYTKPFRQYAEDFSLEVSLSLETQYGVELCHICTIVGSAPYLNDSCQYCHSVRRVHKVLPPVRRGLLTRGTGVPRS